MRIPLRARPDTNPVAGVDNTIVPSPYFFWMTPLTRLTSVMFL